MANELSNQQKQDSYSSTQGEVTMADMAVTVQQYKWEVGRIRRRKNEYRKFGNRRYGPVDSIV